VQNRTTAGEKRHELAPLDAAGLEMIGTQREYGSLAGLAEFRNVSGLPIHDHPAHAGGCRRTGDLRKCRPTDRLKYDGIGALLGAA